ncbi:unnamed protein product [Microthlaspi erraticum]|uniref:Uncharacterized protein n=1 Tax=Microthlaspi erraticum TaxID=1685480 RepID=A0A6D2HQ97_9BRAS|nr:unnamed protein product [Microthlaspi erraticum]
MYSVSRVDGCLERKPRHSCYVGNMDGTSGASSSLLSESDVVSWSESVEVGKIGDFRVGGALYFFVSNSRYRWSKSRRRRVDCGGRNVKIWKNVLLKQNISWH